jgi:hypothetical protein
MERRSSSAVQIKGGGGDVPKKHWGIADIFCCFPDFFTEYEYRV